MITLQILTGVFNTDVEKLAQFVEPLNRHMKLCEINTPLRQAAFLAQTGHESAGFSRIVENLNYSQAGLMRVFKKHFPTVESTEGYVRNPERIANKVYANRMGNRGESSGDGWKYRGRGLIQITGRNNYIELSLDFNMVGDSVIAYLGTVEGAVASAGWFWRKHSLNPLADLEDIMAITKRINGGVIGLEERMRLYNRFKEMLAE